MKILHFADLHLGHETYGKIDEKTGLNTRLLDFLKSFDYLVNYTLNNKVDLVIFAGDAYKTRDPSPTYQREFAKRIKKIASKIPVVLITGNHDIPPSFGKADTLEIFPALEVPNVYVFSKPEVKTIPIPNPQSSSHPIIYLSILALPWLLRQHLLNEEERKKPIEELRNILSSKISQIFQDLLKKIDPEKPAVALVHQSVSGATFPSNQDVYIGKDPLIPVSLLSHPKLSYIALGHIHKFQVINEKPPVIYPGSIERIDFGEEKERKGFVVVEIEKGKKTKWQFVPINARKFKTINIEIPEKEASPMNLVKKQIQKADITDAIVRISITGAESALSKISQIDLKELTKSAHFLASISKKSEKETTRLEIGTEELGPMQWLAKYLEIKKLKKEDMKILKETAFKLMEEIS